MKEIVSVQIGGFANYVGSHFWNFQDELLGLASEAPPNSIFSNSGINMDVLYRVGETRQGVATYTPRLLAIDSRGSLGAVRASGSLYGEPVSSETFSVSTWDGQASKHTAERVEKTLFLHSLEDEELECVASQEDHFEGLTNVSDMHVGTRIERDRTIVQSLDNHVEFWTDYCKVHFHPSSIYELQGVWNGVTPFEDFGSGKGLLGETMQVEPIQEKLRFFIEECDQLQGLQVLVDESTGFAGVGADFLETISDDYDRSPVLVFSVRSPSSFSQPRNSWNSTIRALHDAISFVSLSCSSKLLVPIGLPSLARSELSKYLCINDAKQYHSSAVYSAAINCITLAFRIEPVSPSARSQEICIGGADMQVLTSFLSQYNGKGISILDFAMPAPPISGIGASDIFTSAKLQPLLTNLDDAIGRQTQTLVIQGALKSGSNKYASVSEVVNYMQKRSAGSSSGSSFCHLAVSACPLAIPLPFPCIFAPSVGVQGEISDCFTSQSPKSGLDVQSIPLAARLRVSKAILPFIQSKLHNLRHFGLARGSQGAKVLEGWGFEKAEIRELEENISDLTAAYGGIAMEESSDSD